MNKKQAFTMSEALIVLGIVAVLAALSVVAINNSKPDENITMFRRAYSTTAKIVQEMMNDRELYPNADKEAKSNEAIDPDSVLGSAGSIKGFMDFSITAEIKQKHPYLDTTGRKFAIAFAYKSNAIDVSDVDNKTKVFTTPDGIYWTVQDCFVTGGYACGNAGPNKPGTMPPAGGNYAYARYALVTVYLNGEDTDKSCQYNANTCPYPTEFKFLVLPNGTITPTLNGDAIDPDVDPMACSYLRYPKAVRNSQIPTDAATNNCFAN